MTRQRRLMNWAVSGLGRTGFGWACMALTACSSVPLESSADATPNEPIYYHNPAWSPDGEWIAFYSNRDGNFEVYTIRPDGSDLRRLTHHEAGDSEPSWSPDGTRIAFDSGRGGDSAIFVMDADGTNPTRVSGSEPASTPVWAPDGSRIAYEGRVDGNRDLFVMNADGTSPTRLTVHEANDFRPSWSPDASRIVFSSKRRGSYDLYTMKADGSEVSLLVGDPQTHETCPAWSPDGGRLLFTRIGEESELYVLDLATGEQTRLLVRPDRDPMVSWSPDGTRIAYVYEDEDGLGLWTMDASGRNPVRLMPPRD